MVLKIIVFMAIEYASNLYEIIPHQISQSNQIYVRVGYDIHSQL